MNKFFTALIALVVVSTTAFGQKSYTSEKDVFEAKDVVFYGYDFSHFKLAEAKRIFENNNVKKLIPAWIEYVNSHNSNVSLQRNLKKDIVTLNFDYTLDLIKNINEDGLVVVVKHTIPLDSIQSIVSRYAVKEKEGVGFVVIVECFEKVKEKASAYFTFFDIATKKVLMSDYYVANDADGYGMVNHWGVGLRVTVAKYFARVYKKKWKEFEHQQ